MTHADPPPSSARLRILFVCSGNTCRSPMAEVLARRIAREVGLTQVEVRSAGTSTGFGLPASEGARRAAASHGLDLESHRSSPLSREHLEWADRILTMGPSHLLRVLELGGGGKAVLLGAFAEGGEDGEDKAGRGDWDLAVPDPFGGDDRVYEETFETLERYVNLAIKRMARHPSPSTGGEGGEDPPGEPELPSGGEA